MKWESSLCDKLLTWLFLLSVWTCVAMRNGGGANMNPALNPPGNIYAYIAVVVVVVGFCCCCC